MPTSSLTRALAARRIALTGEAWSQALDRMRVGVAALSKRQKAVAGMLLEGEGDARIEPDEVAPLRSLLCPDALTAGQRELEAGMAWASNKAISYLHLRPGGGFQVPARVFRSVSALDRGLALRLHPDALPAVLVELLPQLTDDGELHGVAGLRYRQHPSCGELFLADNPSARIVLAGVTKRVWAAAVAFANAAYDRRPDWTWEADPWRLTRSEALAVEEHSRTAGPLAMTSGILRRHNVFGTALWSKWWSMGPHLSIEWPGGPARTDAANLLVDRLFGLEGCTITTTSRERAVIAEVGGEATAALRSTDVPDPDTSAGILEAFADPGGRGGGVHQAWRAYWQATAGDRR